MDEPVTADAPDGGRSELRRARAARDAGAPDPALAVGLPPDDRRYYPLYAECCELELTFCTQVGHAGPLCASEPAVPSPTSTTSHSSSPTSHRRRPHRRTMARRDDLAREVPERLHRHLGLQGDRYPAQLRDYIKGPAERRSSSARTTRSGRHRTALPVSTASTSTTPLHGPSSTRTPPRSSYWSRINPRGGSCRCRSCCGRHRPDTSSRACRRTTGPDTCCTIASCLRPAPW